MYHICHLRSSLLAQIFSGFIFLVFYGSVNVFYRKTKPHIYHDLLYVVPRVRVSRRTLQCRVRHLTPTYVMTNELQKTKLFLRSLLV